MNQKKILSLKKELKKQNNFLKKKARKKERRNKVKLF